MCHLVLLMPIFGLAVFWVLPFGVASPVYAVILALSAILYWKIMRAMQRPVQTGVEPMVGEFAKVIDTIRPRGRVQLHGEIWNAVSSDVVRKGDSAEIIALEGLTLLVRKAQDRSTSRQRKTRASCALR
ncbi:MAG: NfeD family protein [Candidatus Binatia bacterium]